MESEGILDQMPDNFSKEFLLNGQLDVTDDISSIIFSEELLEKDILSQNEHRENTSATGLSIAMPRETNEKIIDGDEISNLSSPHVFLLAQQLTVDGRWVSKYFCPSCNKDYNSVNEFALEHPDVLIAQPLGETQPLEDLSVQDEQNFLSCIEFDESEIIAEESNEVVDKGEEETTILFDPMTIGAHDECLFFCSSCEQVYNETSGSHNCCSMKGQRKCNSPQIEVVNEKGQEILGSEEFPCAHCRKKFTSPGDRIKHAGKCLNQEKPNVFYCPICGNEHINLRSFKFHVCKCSQLKVKIPLKTTKNTPEKSKEAFCNLCNTTFSTEKNLKMHMRMHNKRDLKSIQEALPPGICDEYKEVDTFYCEICEKSFEQNLLSVHKNMHLKVGDRNCYKCNRLFGDEESYSIHLLMHIKNSKKSNEIKRLSNFLTEGELNSTSRSNLEKGGRTHSCQFCGKGFSRPYLKVKHERVHTGEKPYECEVCGKSFRVSYSLTLHLRTHTDIRPYVCTICNKRFKSHSACMHHTKTHNTERPYKCDQCDKSFRTSVQLCCHKNGHTKPFNCNSCSRAFRSMTAVRLHMKMHQKSKVNHTCHVCGAGYERINSLHVHVKEVHNIKINLKEYKNRKKNELQKNKHNSHRLYQKQKIRQKEPKQTKLQEPINDINETVVATQSILQNDGYFFMDELI